MYMPRPQSHQEALQVFLDKCRTWVEDGTFSQATYPATTYGVFILLLFMMVPPTSRFHNPFTRHLTFAIILCVHGWMISNLKPAGTAWAYGVGIVFGWGTIWTATLLIFHDAKTEFKRLERRTSAKGDGMTDASSTSSKLSIGSQDNLRARKEPSTKTSPKTIFTGVGGDSDSVYYVWQPYPIESFRHRLLWNLELIASFRGLDWNWCVSGTPSLPSAVQASLQHSINAPTTHINTIVDKVTTRTGLRRFDSVRPLLLHNFALFARTYMALDMIKLLTIHDPYFWSYGSLASPTAPRYLPFSLLRDTPILLRMYRTLTVLCGAWMILRLIFTLAPLTFVMLLGPQRLGLYAEPWLYPDQFGSYANISERGIAGFWGGWWHQMFRFAFESAGRWTVSVLGLDPASELGKIVQLFAAFATSGCLHACGSITGLGDTHPWRGPFLFFLTQPIAILLQTGWLAWLKRAGLQDRIPRLLGQVTNVVFTFTWLYYSSPLLVDDFTNSGVWLSEVYPVSILRALGLGVEGDVVIGWWQKYLWWHSDVRNPLLSGVAF